MVAVWAVTAFYLAGVVGAGFASGRELVVFFVRYGPAGLAGLFMALLLFCLGTYLALEACSKHDVSSYGELFQAISPKWRAVLDLLYAAFLLVGSAVMFAGLAAAAKTPLGGFVLRFSSALLVYAALRGGVEKVLRLSSWLTPVLVAGLCLMAAVRLSGPQQPILIPESRSSKFMPGLEAGLLYACYNLGFALSFLASSHQHLRTQAQRWGLAVLGNSVLGLCMLLLYLALSTLDTAQLEQPFPLLNLLPKSGWQQGYLILLWAAMYSTALANSLALTSRLAQLRNVNWTAAACAAVAVGAGLSYFGFGWLIETAYPILGLAGLWLLVRLVWEAAG